jgi:hypothetical protein
MSGNYRLVRGAVDLREKLFDTLDDLFAGRITPARASAVCRIAKEINASVMSELIEVRIMREAKALDSGIAEEQKSLPVSLLPQ